MSLSKALLKTTNLSKNYVLHNTTRLGLKMALQQGGIAAPSMAIVNADHGIEHLRFGELTFVMNPNVLLNGKKTSSQRTSDGVCYSGDAAAARNPDIKAKTLSRKVNALQERAEGLNPDTVVRDDFFYKLTNRKGKIDVIEWMEKAESSTFVKSLFLKEELGIEIDVPKKVTPKVRLTKEQFFYQKYKDSNEIIDLMIEEPVNLEKIQEIHLESIEYARRFTPESSIKATTALNEAAALSGDELFEYFQDQAVASLNGETPDNEPPKYDTEKWRQLADTKINEHRPEFKEWISNLIESAVSDYFYEVDDKKINSADRLVSYKKKNFGAGREECIHFSTSSLINATSTRIYDLDEINDAAEKTSPLTAEDKKLSDRLGSAIREFDDLLTSHLDRRNYLRDANELKLDMLISTLKGHSDLNVMMDKWEVPNENRKELSGTFDELESRYHEISDKREYLEAVTYRVIQFNPDDIQAVVVKDKDVALVTKLLGEQGHSIPVVGYDPREKHSKTMAVTSFKSLNDHLVEMECKATLTKKNSQSLSL